MAANEPLAKLILAKGLLKCVDPKNVPLCLLALLQVGAKILARSLDTAPEAGLRLSLSVI